MWTNKLDKRNAGLVQHYLERILEMNDKIDFLWAFEFIVLKRFLDDVKYHREKLS